jgi:hypothetical protein
MFGYAPKFSSVTDFLEYFEFFKPKHIALDVNEEVYTQKYKEFVESKSFKDLMKRAEANVKTGAHLELQEMGYDPADWIRLLALYRCMGNRCRIIFRGDAPGKVDEDNLKITQLVEEAPASVKDLFKQAEVQAPPGKNPDNKLRAEEIASKMNRQHTIFTKPKETNYFAIVPQTEIDDFETWWRHVCQLKFRINVLDPSDPSVTDEVEKEEFRKQLTRTK